MNTVQPIGSNMPEREEDREPLNTESMIENSFLSSIKLPEGLIGSLSGESTPIVKIATTNANFDTETHLLQLYNVRDDLIRMYSYTSGGDDGLTKNINALGLCINDLGGQIEKFDPIASVSGLKAPNFQKNAERVIETTKSCYSLGEVSDSSIEEDGQRIDITFSGSDGKMNYAAKGQITSKEEWHGNEAIDYIYTPGEGRMSVKAFDNGQWVDIGDNFEICWELIETEGDTPEIVSEKDASSEKDIAVSVENNLDEEDDFPIQEK